MSINSLNIYHDEYVGPDNHRIWSFEYADTTARTAAAGFVLCAGNPEKPFDADDLGKVAKQNNISGSDGVVTYWVLTGFSPIQWKELTNETVPPDLEVKVKVSSADTTAGFLGNKIVADNGTNTTNPLEASIVNPAGDEDLRIRFDQTKVNHDALVNFAANEHIDHTAVSISTSEGIQGGGNISATRSLKLDINGLTEDTNPDSAADFVATWDASAGVHKKVKLSNSDQKAKVSSNDTTPGFLNGKLVAGTNITLTENNNGSNETLTIATTGTLDSETAAAQARRTTNFTILTSWSDIPLDTTDVENQPLVVSHDNTDTDRIYVYETGLYLIAYACNIDTNDSDEVYLLRVNKNDSVEIPGSGSGSGSAMQDDDDDDDFDNFSVSKTFVAELIAGDWVSFQVIQNTGDLVSAPLQRATLVVARWKGAKGDPGATGSGSSVLVADEGSNIPNTPHSRLNFVGAGVSVTDGGGGSATVAIPGTTLPVYGTQFQETSSEGQSNTTSTTYQTKLTLTTPSLPSGKYRIGWYYELTSNNNTYDFNGRVRINATTDLSNANIELQDTTTWMSQSGFVYQTISEVNSFTVEYGSENALAQASIRKARLEIWRVS